MSEPGQFCHARRMDWKAFAGALTGERLPAALVDLDALDRNIARLRSAVEPSGKTLRVASKSVRHVGLTRRILEGGRGVFQGLMCFTLEEACFLADEGLDDLLVAYPSVGGTGGDGPGRSSALDEIARRVADGHVIRLMADHEAHLSAYAAAGARAGTTIEVLLDVDVAYQPLSGLRLGVLRSPIRSAARVAELTRAARSMDGVKLVGLMGYEAHVAGLPDENPFSRAMNPARRALKRLFVPQVAARREAAVRAMRDAGVSPTVVNGGGTGSVSTTMREACVTEVTAGSGFLCPHLFDYYQGNVLEPAAFFALEISRVPEPSVITCLGGGYVASGEPGWDRLPIPWAPPGLEYVAMEGAGEVMTPLRVPPHAAPLSIGDPVVFRHAKAGELAERFDCYLLLRNGKIVAREPTYRGMGRCFL